MNRLSRFGGTSPRVPTVNARRNRFGAILLGTRATRSSGGFRDAIRVKNSGSSLPEQGGAVSGSLSLPQPVHLVNPVGKEKTNGIVTA